MRSVRVQFNMLKTVATFTNPIEAHIVRGRLECEEILAFVSHEHHIWANWALSQALGGVKVQVPSSDVEIASSVISDINSEKFLEVMDESKNHENDLTCARCNSNKISSVSWSWKLSLVAFFVIMIPLPYTTKHLKCETCKLSWINSKDRAYPLISLGMVLIALYFCVWLAVSGAYFFCKTNFLNEICI